MIEFKKLKTIEEFMAQVIDKGFLKEAAYEDGKVIIKGYDGYSEYEANNESPQSEDQYNGYFTENTTQKNIMDAVRILRSYPEVKSVRYILNSVESHYDVTIERGALNEFLGYDITSLDDETSSDWDIKFRDVYIGGVRNEKRKAFLEHFKS